MPFDIIVANPPYVAADDPHLADLRHEPLDALTDHADGLAHLRAIAQGAPAHLAAGGLLFIEHGFDQGAAVRAILLAAGFAAVKTLQDAAGVDRICAARRG
jgi:release factor glutamine methyltransferase